MPRIVPWLAVLLAPAVVNAQAPPPGAVPPVFTTAAADDQLLFRGDPFDNPTPAAGSRWHLATGADVLLLSPRFTSNPVFSVQTFAPTGFGPNGTVRRIDEFSYSTSVSPRLWVALADSQTGFGFRTRWFLFDQAAKGKMIDNPGIPAGAQNASLVTSVSPLLAIGTPVTAPAVNSVRIPGNDRTDRLFFASRLRVHQWDLDATLGDITSGSWVVTAFAGARYADLSQGYSASLAGAVPQFLESGHSFVGWGPTAGVEVRRGFADTRLAAFGSLRYSALIGNAKFGEYGANIGLIPSQNGGLTLHDDLAKRRAILSVVDLELGGEWTQPFGRAEFLFRPAFIATVYSGGNATGVLGDFGLVGVSLTTGLRF